MEKLNRTARAFTLVELLVVIGVIAILVSILLPVLNKARHEAKNAGCRSNMRQIVMAVTMYAQDNRGYYPSDRSFETGVAFDPGFVSCYDPGFVVANGYDWRPAFRRYLGPRLKGIFTCPLRPAMFENGAQSYRDLDTYNGSAEPENDTTYAMFFGRSPIPSPSTTNWLRVKQGMLKVGQGAKFEMSNQRLEDKEFHVLLMDVVKRWPTSVATRHGPYGAPSVSTQAVSGQDKRYIFISTNERFDFNYATDDGAVQSRRGIKVNSLSITTTYRDTSRGFVLPLEN